MSLALRDDTRLTVTAGLLFFPGAFLARFLLASGLPVGMTTFKFVPAGLAAAGGWAVVVLVALPAPGLPTALDVEEGAAPLACRPLADETEEAEGGLDLATPPLAAAEAGVRLAGFRTAAAPPAAAALLALGGGAALSVEVDVVDGAAAAPPEPRPWSPAAAGGSALLGDGPPNGLALAALASSNEIRASRSAWDLRICSISDSKPRKRSSTSRRRDGGAGLPVDDDAEGGTGGGRSAAALGASGDCTGDCSGARSRKDDCGSEA